MPDMIAVLDGLIANPNTQQGSGWTTRNVSGSGGANYGGGSSYYPGNPTMPSSEGLAGMEQGWMDDTTPQREPQDDYAGYLAAFNGGSYVVSGVGDSDATQATGYQGRSLTSQAGWVGTDRNVSGSGGANYGGGSSWYAGNPTMPSSEGLASLERAFYGAPRIQSADAMYRAPSGYETRNVSASGGANYSGGSSYFPGAPTMPSSEGLARVTLRGLLGLGVDPMRAAAGVMRAKPVFVVDPNNLCGSAYDAAYKSARMAGYDDQWAQMAGQRVAERCMAVGWDMYATKA
jgi:hypothetical protein